MKSHWTSFMRTSETDDTLPLASKVAAPAPKLANRTDDVVCSCAEGASVPRPMRDVVVKTTTSDPAVAL